MELDGQDIGALTKTVEVALLAPAKVNIGAASIEPNGPKAIGTVA